MSSEISKQQLEVMDELKGGATIRVYRGTRTGLRAFISKMEPGLSSMNIRITTVMALNRKKIIERKKALDWDDWAGDWTLRK